jgi:hypothetical protein
MAIQTTSVPTRIQPVGTYNPVKRLSPTPPTTGGQGGIHVPSVPQGAKNFFGDVWSGSVDQLKANGGRVLHPVDTVKDAISYIDKSPRQAFHAIVDPYTNEIKAGHTGRAVGKLVANVATVAGAVLGGRFLFGRLTGGGASVGFSGPIGTFVSGVGNVVGKVTRPIANVVGGVFHGIGNVIRAIIPGGPSVGFR